MKKYLKKILALTLILSLCTTTVLSGTLAKYVSEESGTATVVAAQFYLDADVSANENKIIDLGFTKDYSTTDTLDGDYYNTSATLFPGQSGYFTVDASFISDVDTTITTIVGAAIVPYLNSADVSSTVTLTETTSDLLDATGLRFYIVSNSEEGYTDVAAVKTAATATTAYTYSAFPEALASTLFEDNDSSFKNGVDSYNADTTDGKTVYQYDADTQSSTVAIKGTTYYVYWNWEYEIIDSDSLVVGSYSEGTDYKYHSLLDTDEAVDYDTAALALAADSATLVAADAADTAWGNAVYTDLSTLNAKSDVLNAINVAFSISIDATQLEEPLEPTT